VLAIVVLKFHHRLQILSNRKRVPELVCVDLQSFVVQMEIIIRVIAVILAVCKEPIGLACRLIVPPLEPHLDRCNDSYGPAMLLDADLGDFDFSKAGMVG